MGKHSSSVRQSVAIAIGTIALRSLEIPQERIGNDPRILKAAEDLLKLLAVPDRPAGARIDRRGRPRTHDMGFARDAMIAMAIESPDGLPSRQSIFSARLRDRFIEAGKPEPGSTWLSKAVGGFYQSCNRLTLEAIDRFRASDDLQRTFGSEAAFVAWSKRCLMLERQWHESVELQQRFDTPQAYITHRAKAANLR